MQHDYYNLINSVKKKLKYAADKADMIQHI
jgi:hypothetical protein